MAFNSPDQAGHCTGMTITNEGLKALSKLQNLEAIFVRVFDFSGPVVTVDVTPFEQPSSLKALYLDGSYAVDRAMYEKLMSARPDLEFGCRLTEQ